MNKDGKCAAGDGSRHLRVLSAVLMAKKTDEPQHGFPKTDDSQDINRKSRNTVQYGAGKATVFFGTAMKERVAY